MITIYRFTITRPNSLDPLEVIADATRQAQAESLVKESTNPESPDSLYYRYELDGDIGTDAVLVVEGSEEAPVADIAGLMNTRYGHPEPKVEEITRFDSEISSNPERSAS